MAHAMNLTPPTESDADADHEDGGEKGGPLASELTLAAGSIRVI